MDGTAEAEAAAEERIVNERMRQKLNQVNRAAQLHLSGIQDHINFTLQQSYFNCAYHCFDGTTNNYDQVTDCVERCGLPLQNARNLVETQMSQFQTKLNRSLRVCQDKYEAGKLQHNRNHALQDMESCVEQSIQDSVDFLPHLAGKLKACLSISD